MNAGHLQSQCACGQGNHREIVKASCDMHHRAELMLHKIGYKMAVHLFPNFITFPHKFLFIDERLQQFQTLPVQREEDPCRLHKLPRA